MSDLLTMTKDQLKALETKYGVGKFCYVCGNPGIIYEGLVEGYSCPKCGSSDEDE